MGGIVGRVGVLVGSGVGGVETDGTGAIVGGFVGGFVRVGGAVGAATEGDAVGVAVRASVPPGSVIAGPGNVCGGFEPPGDDPDGDELAAAGASLGLGVALSRVKLNPARATPTASDGPRSTYRVKEARPVWPRAWPPDFPSLPTPAGSFITRGNSAKSYYPVTTMLNLNSPPARCPLSFSTCTGASPTLDETGLAERAT
jgi:hypothetical protein